MLLILTAEENRLSNYPAIDVSDFDLICIVGFNKERASLNMSAV